MAKIINKRDLSAILGVAERTLTEWQKIGLPFIVGTTRGAPNHYDVPEVIAWMVAREVSKSSTEGDRHRLARLQGDLIEIQLAEKRGTMIPAAALEPAWIAMIVAARQTLLAMPTQLAPLLAAMSEVDQIRDLLDEQTHAALEKLAAHDQPPGPDGDADARASALGAPAADPAVSVGGAKPRVARRKRHAGAV